LFNKFELQELKLKKYAGNWIIWWT
jgi:hypothetical protein